MKIQNKRFWFKSPFGPHILEYWWKGPQNPRKTATAHSGFARYKWNWRGQCIGVYSTRDFLKDPIPNGGI